MKRSILAACAAAAGLVLWVWTPIGVATPTRTGTTAEPSGIDGYVMVRSFTPATVPKPSTEALRESDGNGLGLNNENVHSVSFWVYDDVDSLDNPFMSSPSEEIRIHFRLIPAPPTASATYGLNPIGGDDFHLVDIATGLEVPYFSGPAWFEKVIPMNTPLSGPGSNLAKMEFLAWDDPNPVGPPDPVDFEAALFVIVDVDTNSGNYAPGTFNRGFRWLLEESD